MSDTLRGSDFELPASDTIRQLHPALSTVTEITNRISTYSLCEMIAYTGRPLQDQSRAVLIGPDKPVPVLPLSRTGTDGQDWTVQDHEMVRSHTSPVPVLEPVLDRS